MILAMELVELQARLARLATEPDALRRKLVALGVLSARLASTGIEPILVGGAAVEFYTEGGYATKDTDLALPVSPEVNAAFSDLGFAREGRYWYREDLDLLFEAPAPAGLPGEDAPRTEVEVDGLRVVVIGIEDLLLDRIRAWVHWQSVEDQRWARRLALLHADRVDWDYLRGRAAAEPAEAGALAEIEREARGQ